MYWIEGIRYKRKQLAAERVFQKLVYANWPLSELYEYAAIIEGIWIDN